MPTDPAVLLGLRPRMMSVAYRMLGTVADAEDAVQDAFVRFQAAGDVASPAGFLIRTTTRLCIDRLRAAKRRKGYVGPWLPEPVLTRGRGAGGALAESLTQAFLLMLERLSPEERAAFLLRTVFEYEFGEIAEVIGKTETHVRQIVSRARRRLESGEARFRPAPQEADDLAERFVAACRAGDAMAVEQLFAEGAEVHTDGGGKAPAAGVVVRGQDRAARFLAGVFSKKRADCELHKATVNGVPGVVFTRGGVVVLVAALHFEDGVRAVYLTTNPDKLARWAEAAVE